MLREVELLGAENARLRALLIRHGIPSEVADPEASLTPSGQSELDTVPTGSQLSTDDKVRLIRRLFHGRPDVFSLRWEGKNGKSGYSPACGNEWRAGICEKPRVKCADCAHRQFLPVSEQIIYDHLSGRHTVGIYPVLPDNTCKFLAVDFDDADWCEDARAFLESCRELDIPAALEVSRSGQGAHVWVFFTDAVPAGEARRLGTAIISHTCARTRQLQLSSYDRLFPNQDTVPRGGFGNLIALPLQKEPRNRGHSVFVDADFEPYSDQWAFLASLQRVPVERIDMAIRQATGGGHPLDVAFITDEDLAEPWRRASAPQRLPAPLPQRLTATLADRLYFEKADLPQPLANRLIRLAAFQNPEFHKAQAMRFPVWDKPRVIGCAENYPRHIALPRGCLDTVTNLLAGNGIALDIHDKRHGGEPLPITFSGTLRPDQSTAVEAMLQHDAGVLCAPTAFGKTVAAAAIIAHRAVNTLILVHRTELLDQWHERLQSFLDVEPGAIGRVGGGRRKPTGRIDIAVMQSLARKGEVDGMVERYGQVVVDECHHLSAVSFEAILKRARARYVLGLTATPVRRDGHQPIIFMQCGPVRHTAARSEVTPSRMEVAPQVLNAPIPVDTVAGIQAVFRYLVKDEERNARIVADVRAACRQGRKVLVLTERADHLEALERLLSTSLDNLFVLHGRMPRKRRKLVLSALEELGDAAPRVLLATGRLIGEGFDHPPLDTLVLAMPISWKGTLQQYAGRLHRDHPTKSDIRIHDYVDAGHPALARMWERRQAGYRAMGYRILEYGVGALFEATGVLK